MQISNIGDIYWRFIVYFCSFLIRNCNIILTIKRKQSTEHTNNDRVTKLFQFFFCYCKKMHIIVCYCSTNCLSSVKFINNNNKNAFEISLQAKSSTDTYSLRCSLKLASIWQSWNKWIKISIKVISNDFLATFERMVFIYCAWVQVKYVKIMYIFRILKSMVNGFTFSIGSLSL